MRQQRQITDNGRRSLGVWVAKERRSEAIASKVFDWMKSTNIIEKIGKLPTQAQFSRWMSTETGLLITEGVINRLEAGTYKSAPPIEVIAALEELEVLKFGDVPCSMLEIFYVLTEDLAPETGWAIAPSKK